MEDIVLAIRDLTEEIREIKKILQKYTEPVITHTLSDDYSFPVDDSSTASYR